MPQIDFCSVSNGPQTFAGDLGMERRLRADLFPGVGQSSTGGALLQVAVPPLSLHHPGWESLISHVAFSNDNLKSADPALMYSSPMITEQ